MPQIHSSKAHGAYLVLFKFIFKILFVCSLFLFGNGRNPGFLVSDVFVTFQFNVLVQGWYLILSITGICLLPYFI